MGVLEPWGVSCRTLEVADEELLLIEFPLPEPTIPLELTPSEVAVVKLLLDDRRPDEIARLRRSSVNTVRNQIRSIHEKLKVSNTSELARLCFAPPPGRGSRAG